MKVVVDIPEIPKNDKQRWALANGTPYPHGEWEYDDRSGQFICSECEGGVDMPTLMGEPLYKWCPWCGADMRKKEGERND